MRGRCCPPKHPRRQNQCRWATLLFLPNLTMPIRSALVSEEIHWQKSSCITKANNLQLWEIKPCQEVQLAISREQTPLLSCLWKYSSIIAFFPWIYIHVCLWVPLCFGNLFRRFQFFCMGPVLYNKTVRDIAASETSALFGKLATDFSTQIMFMAAYSWEWTGATCAHAMNGAAEKKPDLVTFP